MIRTKKLLLGTLAAAVVFCGGMAYQDREPQAHAQSTASCPTGSYEIDRKEDTGDPICKLEPTGCPYGDSIPLGPECDKHAPVTETEKDTTPPNPQRPYYDGSGNKYDYQGNLIEAAQPGVRAKSACQQ